MDYIEHSSSSLKKDSSVLSVTESKWMRYVVLVLWAAVIVFMILNRNSISMESIMAFSQENWMLIALTLVSLFALKGVCMVIYSGLLFAASGILLPLPMAIAVNVIGIAVMVTVPFFLTRFVGGNAADQIREKYPKAAGLLQRRGESDLLFTMILRIIKVIPVEALSIYLSAIGTRYLPYLLGSVLGMLPSAILFPIMGTNVGDLHSPEFLIAASLELSLVLLSFVLLRILQKRKLRTI